MNIATALAVVDGLVDTDVAVEAIKGFKPVEHRIEFVRELNGVNGIMILQVHLLQEHYQD